MMGTHKRYLLGRIYKQRERGKVFFKFFKIDEKENILLTRLDLRYDSSNSTQIHVAKLKNFICLQFLFWQLLTCISTIIIIQMLIFFQLHLCLFVNLERITAHATHQIVGFLLHINPTISQQQRDDCMFSGLKQYNAIDVIIRQNIANETERII